MLQEPISALYSGLWKMVQTISVVFPSSYFSAVARLLSKKRNRLHMTERGDLPIFLTKFDPGVNKVSNIHKCHPSH